MILSDEQLENIVNPKENLHDKKSDDLGNLQSVIAGIGLGATLAIVVVYLMGDE